MLEAIGSHYNGEINFNCKRDCKIFSIMMGIIDLNVYLKKRARTKLINNSQTPLKF